MVLPVINLLIHNFSRLVTGERIILLRVIGRLGLYSFTFLT